jgi:hypothetical protein
MFRRPAEKFGLSAIPLLPQIHQPIDMPGNSWQAIAREPDCASPMVGRFCSWRNGSNKNLDTHFFDGPTYLV